MALLRHKIGRYGLCIFFVLSLNFFIVHLLPGDPLVHLVGEETYFQLQGGNPEALSELRAQYGLDRPLYERFFVSMTHILSFRLGWSSHYGKPVVEILWYRLKWTLLLLFPAMVLSAVFGLLLGCICGRPGKNTPDGFMTPLWLTVYSVPAYCLAFLLLLLFAHLGDFFPLGGMREVSRTGNAVFGDVLRHMVLPLMVLVLHTTAYLYMIMRSTIRQAFGAAHVLTAASKGLTPGRVLMRHVLLNALPPYIAAVAINFGFIAGGALLVEVVFSWQGMGSLMYEAVLSRDYPILSGCFLFLSFSVIGFNIMADLLCGFIDPRMRDDAAIM